MKNKGKRNYWADSRNKRDKLRWPISKKSLSLTNTGTTKCNSTSSNQNAWKETPSIATRKNLSNFSKKSKHLSVKAEGKREKSST